MRLLSFWPSGEHCWSLLESRGFIRCAFEVSVLYAACGLMGAYAIEYFLQKTPCILCVYQRYVLMAVLAYTPFIWMLGKKWMYPKLYLVFPFFYFVNAVIAGYHSGVEQHIFPALEQCRATPIPHGADINVLRDFLLEKPVVPCDKISWQLFGLSMATYNFLGSSGLVFVWSLVLRREKKPKHREVLA